jgi:hypothetical protein
MIGTQQPPPAGTVVSAPAGESSPAPAPTTQFPNPSPPASTVAPPPVLVAPTPAPKDPTPAELAKIKADEVAAAKKKHEDAQLANMGHIVIVRLGAKLYPGIVLDVNEDDTMQVQYFLPNIGSHTHFSLPEVSADPTSGNGWFARS